MDNYTLKTHHVNSKWLLTEVTEFIEEILNNFSIPWENNSQREAILEVIDEWLEELSSRNKIDQWNVICDGRNNNKDDADNNLVHLDVSYRQRNCFNTTELKYIITTQ
jgi:hypothetical protein